MFPLLSFTVLALCATASAISLPRTDAVHLAVSPQCGTLSGGVPADVNAGLSLSTYKTIVAFGGNFCSRSVVVQLNHAYTDSYTGGGTTNGPTWVENLANSVGAQLINHAVSWNHSRATSKVTVCKSLFQRTELDGRISVTAAYGNIPDPATTLYVIFFGIGSSPISAKNILVRASQLKCPRQSNICRLQIVDNYGLGKTNPIGDAFKQDVFASLGTGHSRYGWNVGFASFNSIWNGVLYGSPGYEAFGYTNPGVCVQGNTQCSDPDHTFYWAPGNPSAATHSIMATYITEVLSKCVSST
ncbi:hypothetical protein B0H17DRAFT_1019256 [Mycena rosella]|uniref:Uncharacterized protein n=1 Tax=Mycena rosella TaxID=1033263 RepID=A0AAD7G454_MYCRO|nr:hypothetical protein B0H17DRAFT_1019256 [Mycena rosella]